jgi:hypothetical protein
MVQERSMPWGLAEVRATVDDYFQFWLGDLEGCATKVDVYRRLHARFPARSSKAFEFKFQNISGILYRDGYEFMPGLLPRLHAQTLLAEEVIAYLAEHPELRAAMAREHQAAEGR